MTPLADRPPTVALYARVSSEEQRERQTIQNQVDFYGKYCDLHGLRDAGMYLDDGVTGTIPLEQRPEGARLLRDAQAGIVGQVLLYRLDRIGRDPRIILNAVHQLQEAGVQVKSMTEPFETGTVYGEFMMSILAGVAGLERGVFLERSALGTARAAREGKWLGGIVPYGYRVNAEGYLQVSEAPLEGVNMTEADVIRLIFDCVANRGWSTIKVADHLNALGIPTAYAKDDRLVSRGQRKVATANVWRPARVGRIIRSSTYAGWHAYGKRSRKNRDPIPRAVPAIIDEVTWHRAQETLRRNLIEATRNAKRKYLLRGMVVCGVCGMRYQGTGYQLAGGKAKAYYVCNGKATYKGPHQGRCPSKALPAEWLEHAVWNDVMSFIGDPHTALDRLRSAIATADTQAKDYEREKAQLKETISQCEIEKQRIMVLYRKGVINAVDTELQIQDIERTQSAASDSLAEPEAREAEKETTLAQFASAEELLDSLRSSVEEGLSWDKKRAILQMLVKEIRVLPGRPCPGTRRKPDILVTYVFDKVTVHTDTGLPPSPA